MACAYVYSLCALSGICIQIRLLRVKWLVVSVRLLRSVRINTAFQLLQRISDLLDVSIIVILDVRLFVRRSNDRHA